MNNREGILERFRFKKNSVIMIDIPAAPLLIADSEGVFKTG